MALHKKIERRPTYCYKCKRFVGYRDGVNILCNKCRSLGSRAKNKNRKK